jgi:hypothetical protein
MRRGDARRLQRRAVELDSRDWLAVHAVLGAAGQGEPDAGLADCQDRVGELASRLRRRGRVVARYGAQAPRLVAAAVADIGNDSAWDSIEGLGG